MYLLFKQKQTQPKQNNPPQKNPRNPTKLKTQTTTTKSHKKPHKPTKYKPVQIVSVSSYDVWHRVLLKRKLDSQRRAMDMDKPISKMLRK